jgi:hypothetical protein
MRLQEVVNSQSSSPLKQGKGQPSHPADLCWSRNELDPSQERPGHGSVLRIIVRGLLESCVQFLEVYLEIGRRSFHEMGGQQVAGFNQEPEILQPSVARTDQFLPVQAQDFNRHSSTNAPVPGDRSFLVKNEVP